MRKIVGWFVGVFLAFALGYTLLPKGFSLMIAWLGPVFGTSLHILLAMIYLLFADPFKETTLAVIWGAVGLVTGLVVRKRIAGLLTGIQVYPTMLVFVGLAGFRMFKIFESMNITLANVLLAFPPTPKGATLTSILTAPLVSDIFAKVQATPLTSPGQIVPLATNLVTTLILPNIAKNLIIVAVLALVGGEIGYRIENLNRRRIEGLRLKWSGRSAQAGSISPAGAIKALGLVMIVSLLLVNANIARVAATSAPLGQAPPDYFIEALAGEVSPEGHAFITVFFGDTLKMTIPVNPSSSAFTGAMAMLLVSQENSALIMESTMSSLQPIVQDPTLRLILAEIARYQNLMPPTFLITAYIDVSGDVAQQRAAEAANLFSTGYGITPALSLIISTPVPVGTHTVTTAIYGSDTPLSALVDKFYTSLPDRDGLVDFVRPNWDKLIPGRTAGGPQGALVVSGFMTPKYVVDLINEFGASELGYAKDYLPADVVAPMTVLGLRSSWAYYFHSSPEEFTFNIATFLQATQAIKFSTQADVSSIATIVPDAATNLPQIHLVTTLPSSAVTSALQIAFPKNPTPVVTTLSTGAPVAASLIAVDYTYRFPLQLKAVKTVSPSEGDPGVWIKVTITITNDDDTAAENVVLDDTKLFSYYPTSAKLVEGSATMKWSRIAGKVGTQPGKVEHTYTAQLSREGGYTFPGTVVSYEWGGKSYKATSEPLFVTVRALSVFGLIATGIPVAWKTSVDAVNMIPGLQGMGSTVVPAIIIVVALIIVFDAYRNYRKWLRGPKPKKGKGEEAEAPPQPPPPAAPAPQAPTTQVVIQVQAPQPAPTAFCPACGAPVKVGDTFCSKCGRSLQ